MFKGHIKIESDLTISQYKILKSLLGKDIRKINDKSGYDNSFTFIDLEINDDLNKLKHSGAEKTHGLAGQINYIVAQIKKHNPNIPFILNGKITEIEHGEKIITNVIDSIAKSEFESLMDDD